MVIFGEALLSYARRAAEPTAYIAPEQLEGREVSAQSDLCALGLVFYEMFTGKPAHRADSMAVLLNLLRNPEPRSGGRARDSALSRCGSQEQTHVGDGAGRVGINRRVIAEDRGSSARRCRGGLDITRVMMPKIQVAGHVALENSPEALNVKARENVRSLGYPARPVDSQAGFYYEVSAGEGGRLKASGPEEWRKVIAQLALPILYGHRQSPAELVSQRYFNFGRVNGNDSPPNRVGMVQMTLDTARHMLLFEGGASAVGEAGGISCARLARFVLPRISTCRNSSRMIRSGPSSRHRFARLGPAGIQGLRICPLAWRRRSMGGRCIFKWSGLGRGRLAWPDPGTPHWRSRPRLCPGVPCNCW